MPRQNILLSGHHKIKKLPRKSKLKWMLFIILLLAYLPTTLAPSTSSVTINISTKSTTVATVITTTVAVSSSLTNGGMSTRGRRRTLTKKKEEKRRKSRAITSPQQESFLLILSYSEVNLKLTSDPTHYSPPGEI